MSACEKCWSDTAMYDDHAAAYARILKTRECTPEEQAGPEAKDCNVCDRRTRHQYTGECMACGNNVRGEPIR